MRLNSTAPFILFCILATGCSGGESADTSPLAAQDNQTRVNHATQSVQSSSMTPEQKEAADAYLKQGAAGAEQIRKSAQKTGPGGG